VNCVTFLLAQLGAALALAVVALAAGALAGKALAVRMETGLTLALGLAVWGQAGVGLGLAGLLRPAVLAPLALAAVVIAGRLAWRGLPRIAGLRHGARSTILAGAVGAVIAAPFALAASYPPLAFDETLYHLPFARAFAASGGLPFLGDLRAPVFPALTEVIEAQLLLLAGDAATHMLSLVASVGTALLLIEWARWRGVPRAGWIAAGLFAGSPLVAYASGTALVEPLLAFLWAAALFAADRCRAEPSWRWALTAGLLAGSAASVKYLGLVAVVWVGCELLVLAPRRYRLLAVTALGATLGMALCYGRILVWTGNPLFPFFSSLFGRSPWTALDVSAPPFGVQAPAAWLTLPWDAIFDPDAVGDLPPFSPAWILAAPLLLRAAARRGWAARALFMSLLYSLSVPLHARYLMPLLPPLALAAAQEWTRWTARWPPRWTGAAAAAATAALLLLPGWGYALFHLHRLGPLPVTAEQRDGFWQRHLPLYPAIRHLNRAYGGEYVAYAFDSENLIYMAHGRLLGEWNGPYRFGRFRPLLPSPPALHAALREVGVDYLLLPRASGGLAASAEEWFLPEYGDGAAAVYRLR
jgi:hypothetical protein